MSLFRRIVDRVQLNVSGSAGVQPGGSLQYTLRNRQYWLDGIILTCRLKHGSTTLSSFKSDGIWNGIKRVQLSANEGDGATRTILDAHGAALVEENRQLCGFIDEVTYYNQARTGITATEVLWNVPIMFRHPILPEPASIYTALPLPRYGSDPVLDIQFGTLAEIAGAGALDATFTNIAVEATFLYREVIDLDGKFPHWKTEIISRDHAWASSGAQQYEIPSTGLLCSVYQQNYTSAGTRGDIQNKDTEVWTLEFRNRSIVRMTEAGNRALCGMSMHSDVGYMAHSPEGMFYDLLADVTLTDAFHLRSALDLSPESLKGGKAFIKAQNLASTGYISRFTTRKVMARAEDVAGVTL